MKYIIKAVIICGLKFTYQLQFYFSRCDNGIDKIKKLFSHQYENNKPIIITIETKKYLIGKMSGIAWEIITFSKVMILMKIRFENLIYCDHFERYGITSLAMPCIPPISINKIQCQFVYLCVCVFHFTLSSKIFPKTFFSFQGWKVLVKTELICLKYF